MTTIPPTDQETTPEKITCPDCKYSLLPKNYPKHNCQQRRNRVQREQNEAIERECKQREIETAFWREEESRKASARRTEIEEEKQREKNRAMNVLFEQLECIDPLIAGPIARLQYDLEKLTKKRKADKKKLAEAAEEIETLQRQVRELEDRPTCSCNCGNGRSYYD